jgi:tRNA G18 (ribose-2'-O)-methylase SpoU
LRAASCSGIARVIACGNPRIDSKIARDGADEIELEIHRTLEPVIKQARAEGYRLVGLEQTTNSHNLCQYQFHRKTLLVIGNERTGLSDKLLSLMHDTVEIPVFGLPHSFNVATATAIALYEYCRQFPTG